LKSQAQRDGAFEGDDDDIDEANYEYKFIVEEEVEQIRLDKPPMI